MWRLVGGRSVGGSVVMAGMSVVVMLLAGCSSGPRTASGPAASGPTADEWATAVCGALNPWRATITDLNQRAAVQMAQTTTPGQTQQNLVALVSDARDATESARTGVVAAGVPAVEGGAEVASAFTTSLEQTRDAYAAARTELLGLPLSDETGFYDGVVAVLDRLNQRYEQSGVELAKLDSLELRRAFDRVPGCQ